MPRFKTCFTEYKNANHSSGITMPFIQPKLTINNPNDQFEKEADTMADKIMRMGDPPIQLRPMDIHTIQRKCAHCEEEEQKMQRKEINSQGTAVDTSLENYVGRLNGGGQSLPNEIRSFYEPRFGYDFSNVKVHTDSVAAKSAQSINALAYTSGNNIVFNSDQYSPNTDSGKRLLGHELTHVVQQSSILQSKKIQKASARLVGCTGPFTVPVTGTVIDDPVAEITEAENRANEMMDAAIDELETTRNAILNGAGVGSPTVSDTLGHAIEVMGLDPNSNAFWRNRGLNTAHLLLRRLRAIRSTIGGGGVFYHCATQRRITIGTCLSRGCVGAEAESCAGSFHIILCQIWWDHNLDDRAKELVHEHAHNFAAFIGDAGREGNAECYARFVQIISNIEEGTQRLDLCPNP